MRRLPRVPALVLATCFSYGLFWLHANGPSLALPARMSCIPVATPYASAAASSEADAAARRRVNQIFQHHASAVRSYLCRRGVMPADADDVLQRVFIALTRRLGDVRPEQERGFLFGIAAYEACHQRRSYARRRECCDDTIAASTAPSVRPDELLRRKGVLELFATLLGQLESPLREIVELVELQGFTLGDAATRLRVPVGTAKTRLRRARLVLEGLAEPHR